MSFILFYSFCFYFILFLILFYLDPFYFILFLGFFLFWGINFWLLSKPIPILIKPTQTHHQFTNNPKIIGLSLLAQPAHPYQPLCLLPTTPKTHTCPCSPSRQVPSAPFLTAPRAIPLAIAQTVCHHASLANIPSQDLLQKKTLIHAILRYLIGEQT